MAVHPDFFWFSSSVNYPDPVLLGMNGLNRTNVSAGTTVGAYIRINFVDFALGDCINGAFINAGTTCGTIICDYVCHFSMFFKLANRCKVENIFL